VAARFSTLTGGREWAERFDAIAARDLDPYSAADDLFEEVARDGV
jgi:hypothetical protein